MKRHFILSLIILGSIFSYQLNAQVYINCGCLCGWGYFNTGQNHSVIFNNSVITLDGVNIVPSSTQQVFVGVFYDSVGTACNAGFMEYTGAPNAVAAWQSESGIVNGFATGELMQWKICIVNTVDNIATTYNATATYASGLPNSGYFATNGISSVSNLEAVSQAGINAPDWNYTITGGNHSILIPTTATIAIDGQPISNGDYIGVFFDSLGTLVCAGYTQWTGVTTAISAWGADVGLDGFANNEVFKWMIWQLSTGNSLVAAATYSPQFPNAGNYNTQGISGLSSLIAASIQLDSITAPVSGCNLGSESVSVLVSNPNPIPVQSFYISYSVDGSPTITELVTMTIPSGNSFPLTLPISVDISANGNHTITMFTSATNPVTTSLYNEINTASIQSLEANYCVNEAPVNFMLTPSTAWVNGSGISGSSFNPAAAGTGIHSIHFGNQGLYNCPFEDSIQVMVHALPELNIQNPGPLCIDGSAVELSATPYGGTFSGTGINGNYFNPVFGTQTITYQFTDTWGCTADETASILVQSPEIITQTGLAELHCINDDDVQFSSNGIPSGSGISAYGNNWLFSPSVAGAGSHEIAFILQNGPCTSYDTLIISVSPIPVVNIGNDTLIDANQSHLLDAGLGYTYYNWSNGETTSSIAASISGQYQVTVTNYYGCEGISNTMNLSVAPWGTHISGVNHTILIAESTVFQVGTGTLSTGDFIGVFYDDNGIKKCGGWVQWNGATTGLTAWGDDSTSPDKDGFSEGEAFEWHLFLSNTQEELVALATYTPFFPDSGFYLTNGISSISSLITSFTQSITVPSGWSMFSSYIDLFEPAVATVFAPHLSALNIVKNGQGMIYWPQYSVNMIGNLVIGQGYQIHAFAGFTADFTGMKVNPANHLISLPSGWSILGYLRTSGGDIDIMLAGIQNKIIIVKSDTGLIYWPAYGLDMINNMLPGEGYQIKLNAAGSFTYPPNN